MMSLEKTNNKIFRIISLLIIVSSLFIISSMKIFADGSNIIKDDNFEYTVLDENSVALTSALDEDSLVNKDIIIPSEVQGKKVVQIGQSAFYACDLKSVTIPDTVTEIKDKAFSRCTFLQYIKLPNSIKTLGKSTFSACTSLKEIDLPDFITSIPESLFSSCSSLESIEIPEGVTSIGNLAFANCYNLKEITIPKTITEIAPPVYTKLVFNRCTSLNTIKGYKGTYARTLSRELGCKFIALDASEDDKEFEIKFDADNGSDIVTQPVYKDEILNYTPENITKKGYTFVGWYEDTDNITTEYKNNQTYTKDITYKAKWAHVEGLGAQVKVDKTGIRFGTKLYNDGDEILEKGTVMIPTKLIDTMTQCNITLDTENAAKSIGKVNYEVNKDENYVVYLGTLINIPESQRDTYIRASSYVRYKDKSGNEYIVYAFNKEASINSLLESSN